MSNFEFFYLVVGPIAMLVIGGVLFFGGQYLIELADHRQTAPAGRMIDHRQLGRIVFIILSILVWGWFVWEWLSWSRHD
jgi:hypothetical protein